MPKPDLDAADCRIIAELQANGRLSNVELADKIGLSPSPCLRRVKRLEREGYIEGYRAALRRERPPGGRFPGGWWFETEVEIEFETHEIYRPDIVGWRRERSAQRPTGTPIRLRPDWICEILSRRSRCSPIPGSFVTGSRLRRSSTMPGVSNSCANRMARSMPGSKRTIRARWRSGLACFARISVSLAA